MRRIVDYKAEKSTADYPIFYEDAGSQTKISNALEEIEFITQDAQFNYTWGSFWQEALTYADIAGTAFVVIGDEAEDTTVKLEDNTKIKWLALLPFDHLTWDMNTLTYRTMPTLYTANQNLQSLNLHKSRVIRLYGIRRIGQTQMLDSSLSDMSVLEPLLSHYTELEDCYRNTKEMVKNHSFFVLAKQGLNSITGSKTERELSERLKGLLVGLKNLGGLLIDKERETATVVSRNYGGLKDLIQTNIDEGVCLGITFKSHSQNLLAPLLQFLLLGQFDYH